MPQLAIVASTTWSPGCKVVTAPPTASTTPAPSWPSTAGVGQGMVPSMTLMSLWHTPAFTMRTTTSVGPGSRTSSPSVTSAFPSPTNTIPRIQRTPGETMAPGSSPVSSPSTTMGRPLTMVACTPSGRAE